MDLNQLDATVIDALKQNRKIEAIKRLREKEGIGLKEAKDAVESYLAKHPELVPPSNRSSSRSSNSRLFIIALACLLYLGYDYFLSA